MTSHEELKALYAAREQLNNIIVYHEALQSKVTSTVLANNSFAELRLGAFIAEHYNLTLSDLNSGSRRRDIVHARWMFIYLLRNVLSYSYPTIAYCLNQKHHSTSFYAYKELVNNQELFTEAHGLLIDWNLKTL